MLKPLKQLSRHVKRTNCKSLKVIYTIYVKDVIFNKSAKVRDGTILSVCFERGGKLSSSSDRLYINNNQNKSIPHILSVNETLTLVATLYQDLNTNEFQMKKGKIILRELVKNKFGGNSYAGLGVVTIYLEKYINSDLSNYSNDFDLVLDNSLATIKLSISSQLVGSVNNDNDDTMSVISDKSDRSDVSMVGATFDHDIFNSSQYNLRNWTTNDVIHEEDEENYEENYDNDESDKITTSNTTNNETIQPINSELVDVAITNTTIYINTDANINTTSNQINDPISNINNNTKESPIKSVRYETNNESPSLSNISLMNGEKLDIKTLKDFKNYKLDKSNNQLTNQSIDTIDYLKSEIELLKSDVVHKDSIIASLHKEIDSKETRYKNMMMTLKAEINELNILLSNEKISRNAVTEAYSKSDSNIANALVESQKETELLAKEYSLLSAELLNATEEIDKLNNDIIDLTNQRDEMSAAARDAATAATLARINRSEIELENNDLIDELIITKVNCANYANYFEEERRKNYLLKRKLQKYAERVASLEVQIAQSTTSQSDLDIVSS